MNNINRYKAGIGYVGLPIFILIIAVIVIIRVNNSSNDVEKHLSYSIQALQQNVDQLESRIDELGELVREKHTKLQSYAYIPPESDKVTNQTSKAKAKPGKPGKKEAFVTAMADMDQEVLRDLYDEAVREKELKNQQDILRNINLEQREIDKELYDEAAEDLFRQILPRRPFGNNSSAEERDAALKELLEQYPDSYAAAKAVSMEIMFSARRGEIDKTEEYYNMLIDMQSTKNESIVLDNGQEAVPVASYSIALSYYRNGMTEKIEPVINNLEDDYSTSLINLRSPNGSSVVTGEEAADRLRQITGVK